MSDAPKNLNPSSRLNGMSDDWNVDGSVLGNQTPEAIDTLVVGSSFSYSARTPPPPGSKERRGRGYGAHVDAPYVLASTAQHMPEVKPKLEQLMTSLRTHFAGGPDVRIYLLEALQKRYSSQQRFWKISEHIRDAISAAPARSRRQTCETRHKGAVPVSPGCTCFDEGRALQDGARFNLVSLDLYTGSVYTHTRPFLRGELALPPFAPALRGAFGKAEAVLYSTPMGSSLTRVGDGTCNACEIALAYAQANVQEGGGATARIDAGCGIR
ncbi:hypothetical protein T492DRAFT_836685 [Pavlovales sp. CCMP2436]|nr:hypothetical protein T492DRAFT_836685 [Pavlovales sp. CCMP2436]